MNDGGDGVYLTGYDGSMTVLVRNFQLHTAGKVLVRPNSFDCLDVANVKRLAHHELMTGHGQHPSLNCVKSFPRTHDEGFFIIVI